MSTAGGAKSTAMTATVFTVIAAISFSHFLNDLMQSLLPAIYPMLKDSYGLSFTQVGLLTLTFQFTASLLVLMQAYARLRTKDDFRPFVLDRGPILTMEQALERMRRMIGFAGDWMDLAGWLPEEWRDDPLRRRSATAATFAAALELVKQGQAEIAQTGLFGPIRLRRRRETP